MLTLSRTRVLALLFLTFALLLLHSAQADTNGAKSKLSGHVDWKKGVIYATGLGAIPKEENNDAVAYLKARRFATMDARRNLLAVVDHVRIDSQSVGQDFQSVNDTVREEISGLVKGSEIFAERKLKIGNGMLVEVTVTMPLYGEDSLGSAVYPAIAARNKQVVPGPDDAPLSETPKVRIPDGEETAPAPHNGTAYTGVIIDARRQGVERSMSPKIRRTDGSEVWGTLRVAPEFVIDNGIVGYVHSLSEAKKNARAGDNPLVLHAVGRGGEKFKTDVTLSAEDADRLIEADAQGNFLGQFHVLFIVDEDK